MEVELGGDGPGGGSVAGLQVTWQEAGVWMWDGWVGLR